MSRLMVDLTSVRKIVHESVPDDLIREAARLLTKQYYLKEGLLNNNSSIKD